MEQLLKQILSKLDTLEIDITSIKQNVNELKSDVSELKEGQNEIKDMFRNLEAVNATRHTDIYDSILGLTKDLKFVKHKLHETEEDVFDIKDHLKLVK